MGIVTLIQGACIILWLLIDSGGSKLYPSIKWIQHNPIFSTCKKPELQPGKYYYSIVTPQSCGKSPVSRVIGGVNDKPRSWPRQIALLRGSGKLFSCSASLIAPECVLIAAHCISRGQPGSYYTICRGGPTRHVKEGTEEDVPAKLVILYPDYNKIPIDNDIAAIEVNKKTVLYGVRGKRKAFVAINDILFSDNCGPSPPATGRPTPPPPTDQPSPPPPNTPLVPETSPPGACGKGPIARIFGGKEAKRGDYPWQALLQENGRQFCGGTLISPQWVMSAAHCVEDKEPKDIIIRMGAIYRVDKPCTSQGEQKLTVTKIITHESYNKPKRMSYDVALLKLESPATLDDFTNLACLPSSNPTPGSLCTITGWGLKEDGEKPEKLQVMQVPIMSKETCEEYYPNEIHESMLCAGLPEGGKDSCKGDSGGPMVCKDSDGRYSVHGVTSWGYGCARPGRPGVYARVSFLIKWIEDKINGYQRDL